MKANRNLLALIAVFLGVHARAWTPAQEQRIKALKLLIVQSNNGDSHRLGWENLDCSSKGLQIIGLQFACQSAPPDNRIMGQWQTLFDESMIASGDESARDFTISPWGRERYLLFRPQIPPIPAGASPVQEKKLELTAEVTVPEIIEALRRAQHEVKGIARAARAINDAGRVADQFGGAVGAIRF